MQSDKEQWVGEGVGKQKPCPSANGAKEKRQERSHSVCARTHTHELGRPFETDRKLTPLLFVYGLCIAKVVYGCYLGILEFFGTFVFVSYFKNTGVS